MIRTTTLTSFALMLTTTCFSQVNYLDNYLTSTVTLTTIGNTANQVNQPRDLDFKPNSNELWVCNYGAAQGGSMVTFYNAGLPNQTSQYRKDTHSGHFMVYPSAMAFGDNGEWAAVSEIQNTNTASPTFMGPALWLSDTSIFAKVFQNNWTPGYPLGSHIDMLHQSPFAMGIAHDSLKVYYVMDGYNGNICRYDFVQDHGPGYDDHSAGMIWRYTDVPVGRVADMPSHMVLDRSSRWLYYIDGVSKQVRRMNTATGSVTGNLTVPPTANETLAGYYQVEQVVVEVIDTYTTQPCGIDFYNDRLVVSDNTTGDIYLYNTSGTVTLLGTISTGQPGMMGVKVGPDGKIWCVNYIQNAVYRLDIPNPAVDLGITAITSPQVENFTPAFYSTLFNVCNGSIAPEVVISNSGTTTVTSATIEYTIDGAGTISYSWSGSLTSGSTASVILPSTSVLNGSHLLSVRIVNVNGVTDDVTSNNTIDGSFRIIDPALPVPFTETFTAGTFPPTGYNYIHFNPNNYFSWQAPGGFGLSVGSMRMDNYSGVMDITGQKDYMMLPMMDLSSLTNNAWLRFNVAYARYVNASNDALQVLASTDCGNSWTTVYSKSGIVLSTAGNSSSAFVPSAGQWRTDSVNIQSLAGQSEAIFMFTSISNYGNNIYVDDIYVGDIASGIPQVANANMFAVYPNPVTEVAFIRLSAKVSPAAKGELFSVEGKCVKTFDVSYEDEILLDVSTLSPGYYTIKITDGNSGFVQPVIKQ